MNRLLTASRTVASVSASTLLACSTASGPRAPASIAVSALGLPDRVVLKTTTESFDLFRYYAIRDGRIYFKLIPPSEWAVRPNPKSDVAKLSQEAIHSPDLWQWQLYGPEGLPYAPKGGKGKKFAPAHAIVEISADADQLLAISDEGRVYLKQAASASLTADEDWYSGWGFPETPLVLNAEQRSHRALVMGRRNEYVLFSEDPAGTEHHYGNMGTSSLYFLPSSGQELRFTDSGLPAEFSHRICGPVRSSRRLESISASASTIMALDSEGKIYTKMEDYDLNGGTAMFFDYTYEEPKKITHDGHHVLSNWIPWKLPLDDWRGALSAPSRGSR